jgi:hypothetical protein
MLVTELLDTLAQPDKLVIGHHPRKTATMDFPDLSDTYGQFWKYAIEPM